MNHAKRAWRWRRRGLPFVLLLSLLCSFPTVWAHNKVADIPQISLVLLAPGDPAIRYGVDAVEQVVRSTDGGTSWTAEFSPGDSLAPDPSSPGACLPGNFERVTFLAINPLQPSGLYVGTEGRLGDYQDNGCDNAPGGLFYSANGTSSFMSLNHGLPANADARGGGIAWGVRSISFDPHESTILYVQSDPAFLAVPNVGQLTNPTAPGIYRTFDGGAQWDAAFAGIATSACQFPPCRNPGSVAIDPVQPRNLLFAADTGFYRSANRGATWTLQSRLSYSDNRSILLRIDPFLSTLAYVVTDTAIYRSDDGGAHLNVVKGGSLPVPADVVDFSFTHDSPPLVVFQLRSGSTATVQDGQTPKKPLGKPPTAVAIVPTVTDVKAPPTRVFGGPTETPTAATRAPTVIPSTTSVVTSTPPPQAPTPSVSAQGNGDWTMVGHDAGQSYADPGANLSAASVARLHLRWRLANAAPALAVGNIVYALSGASGVVVALNASTGAITHHYHSTGVQSLAALGKLVYFNRGSEIRIVNGLTADWRHTASYRQGKLLAAFSQVVISRKTIYTSVDVQNSGFLARYYAFDAQTGKARWSNPGNASSIPCVAGATLYMSFGAFGAGDSYLLNADTGAIQHVLKGLGTAQWHSSGDRVYAGVLRGSNGVFRAFIRAYDLRGLLQWEAHDLIFGAALPDKLFAEASGSIEARSVGDGHRLWKTTSPGLRSLIPGNMAVAGNLVLAQTTDGRIDVFDSSTGRLLRILQPPVASDNANNLMVGNGAIFESVSPKTSSGGHSQAMLLAFGL